MKAAANTIELMKIMISYAREDNDTMEAFRDAFLKETAEVWTDQNIPRGSADWRSEIQAAIDGCDGHCVLLSPPAKKSPWVAKENAHSEEQEKPIFPILITGKPRESVPITLSTAQRDDIVSVSATELEARAREIARSILRSIAESKPPNPPSSQL